MFCDISCIREIDELLNLGMKHKRLRFHVILTVSRPLYLYSSNVKKGNKVVKKYSIVGTKVLVSRNLNMGSRPL